MFKKYFIFLVLIVALQAEAKKLYTEVPVLTHLPKSEQNDTFGFNLVEHLPKLIYNQLKNSKIKLWDSPKKQIEISFSAVQKIESDNSVSFSRVENLFINELWTSSLRKTSFVIMGFSFLAESPKGKISFGYVDLSECFGILSQSIIPTNVNGCNQLNYIDALYSRRYFFNLLQFGPNDFSGSPQASFKIKNDAFYSKKKVQDVVKLKNKKEVTYTLEKNPGQENDPATNIFNTIETYINKNKSIIFKHGGDKHYKNNSLLSDFTITRIEILEIWEKKGNLIVYKPSKIKIYINNKALDFIDLEEFNQWKLLFNFKNIEDVLIEKQFSFIIYKINAELIPYEESSLFLRALKEYKWSQVSNFVKYTKE